ncbi:MAG: hypothetical protein JNL74_02520 [Fibrobacteres bacterium]|nr:hypothetical protein [Fibrobacterota bacterium]
MKKIKNMTIGELAAFVSSHLFANGIKAVLSGGACVSIYSTNRYQSYDLDFIENLSTSRKQIKQVLAEIGFKEDLRYFKHPDTEFFVEFPEGPLAVGDEPVKEIIKLKYSTGELTIISPTDSIKDRLAGYYHWNDLQCLDQALMIAEDNKIDLSELKRWSVVERKSHVFDKIKDQFIKAQRKLEKRTKSRPIIS